MIPKLSNSTVPGASFVPSVSRDEQGGVERKRSDLSTVDGASMAGIEIFLCAAVRPTNGT